MSEISLETLALAKKYTDESGGGGGGTGGDKISQKTLNAAKAYADEKDTATLNSAKNYTDSILSEVAPFYAVYGQTTKEEIAAAINNKRQIYLRYGETLLEKIAPYTGSFLYADIWGEGTGYRFALTEGHWQHVFELKSEWTYETNDMNVLRGKSGTITIGTGWSDTNPHTITVTAQGYAITSKTMVSILPHEGTINKMSEDGVQTMYITNNNGTLTAYAIGNKPTAEMTVPVLYTEVE